MIKKKKKSVRKYKILPAHTWETHPSSHLAGVRKPFIIAGVTVALLIVLSLILMFQEQIVGKAFQPAGVNTAGVPEGLRLAANQPNTIVPIKANIGSARTTALRFVMNLPTGLACADLAFENQLPWRSRSAAATPLEAGQEANPSASFTTSASCNNNQLTFEYSTLDASEAKTGVFDVANLKFTNGLAVGAYEFRATEFTIVNLQSPTLEVLNIPLDPAMVTVVQCLTRNHCSGATPVCDEAANRCVAGPPTSQCTGTVPGNANLCANDNTVLTANTLLTLVSACTNEVKCEYTCKTGFRRNAAGTACEIIRETVCNDGIDNDNDGSGDCVDNDCLNQQCNSRNERELCNSNAECRIPQCEGAVPAGAALCPNDDTGLTAHTTRTSVVACTVDRKCEYTTCGNGVINPGEVCDNSIAAPNSKFAIATATCANQQGFTGGTLGCSAACVLDTSQCVTTGVCTARAATCTQAGVNCPNGPSGASVAVAAVTCGGTTPYCNNPSGLCVATCTAPTALCGTQCVNHLTDRNNCGACGTVCTTGQTCVNGQCGVTTQETPPAGGGGGGGGGTRCISRWDCVAWSYCDKNLQQTRTCTDSTNCIRRPKIETKTCSQCAESWTCSSWSACSGGTQTRTCADEHGCGTSATKPVTQQSCQMPSSGYTPPPYVPPPPPPLEPSFWDKYRIPLYIAGSVVGLGLLSWLIFLLARKKKKAYNINELSDWIGAELRMGTSVNDVKQILKEQTGWTVREVEQAFQMQQGKESI